MKKNKEEETNLKDKNMKEQNNLIDKWVIIKMNIQKNYMEKSQKYGYKMIEI